MNMISKSKFSRGLLYTLFVLLSIWLVLILRSASIVWIHKVGMIGFTPWSLFRRYTLISIVIAIIQTLVIVPGIIFFLRRSAFLNLQILVTSLLPLYILNLFIEPIGIWTSRYDWGSVLSLASVFLFPLCVYLILFLYYVRHQSFDPGTQLPPDV